jgi:hypothetical protein
VQPTNRKGAVGIAAVIIMAVIAIVFTTQLLIPQVKQSVQSSATSENLVYGNTSVNQTYTLAKDAADLEAGSFSITGLTVTSNYTFSYVTGAVKILSGTGTGTYAAHYNYYESAYFDNAGERALFAVIVIAAIIGIVIFLFRGFGLMNGE